MLNVPVNNFSVILGTWDGATTSLLLPVLLGGVNMPCLRTQQGTRVGLEPSTSGSGVRGFNHQATAPPFDIGDGDDRVRYLA